MSAIEDEVGALANYLAFESARREEALARFDSVREAAHRWLEAIGEQAGHRHDGLRDAIARFYWDCPAVNERWIAEAFGITPGSTFRVVNDQVPRQCQDCGATMQAPAHRSRTHSDGSAVGWNVCSRCQQRRSNRSAEQLRAHRDRSRRAAEIAAATLRLGGYWLSDDFAIVARKYTDYHYTDGPDMAHCDGTRLTTDTEWARGGTAWFVCKECGSVEQRNLVRWVPESQASEP